MIAGTHDAVLDGGPGADTLSGGGGNDQLDGGADADQLLADAGDDSVDGGDGDDFLDPGAGENTTTGGAGNDTITLSGAAGDQAAGDAGDDELIAGEQGASLEGGEGNDSLVGGPGPDTLRGDAGTDRLDGDAGKDTLDGGPDNDVLDGGAGADDLQGADGSDEVTYALAGDAVTVTVDGQANDGISGEADNVRPGLERVTGSPFDDTLTAGTMPAAFDGGDGFDTLHGGPAPDQLQGGAGADLLDGANGPDLLDGGDGNDTVTYQDRTGPVTVALSDPAPVQGEPGEGDQVLAVENVTGGAGADTLTGAREVANVLQGGPGDDHLTARDQDSASDSLDCGDGRDSATIDPGDVYAIDCEDVTEGTTGVPRASIALRSKRLELGAWRRVLVVVHCGTETVERCVGKVKLRDAKTDRRVARRSFSALAGETRAIRVQIPRKWVTRFRKRHPTRVTVNVRVSARSSAVEGPPATAARRMLIRYRRSGR